MKNYFVYLMTNEHRSVLYVGMTGDLRKRVWQHKSKVGDGFTKRYNVNRLVYFELADTALAAIEREKRIKGGPRWRKVALIEGMNPMWRDLYDEIATL